MKKLWVIIRFEYLRHVLRKRFWLNILSAPVIYVLIVIFAFIATVLAFNTTPIGYVDSKGVLGGAEFRPESGTQWITTDILIFADETAARAALDSHKIQGYYILSEHYLEDQQARLVYIEEPDPTTKKTFTTFIRAALLASLPDNTAARVANGPVVTTKSTEEARQTAANLASNLFSTLIWPGLAGGLLFMAIFVCSTYLVQSLVDEKENRTMEILATSASPLEIMNAKIIALTAVGFTPVVFWAALPTFLALVVVLLKPHLLAGLTLGVPALVLLLVIPTYVTVAALTAITGVSAAEPGDGQLYIAMISLPVYIPIILFLNIQASPSSPFALFLSYFPLTAAITLLIRIGAETVPAWQIGSSAALQVLLAGASLWLAGKLFRLRMLRYGKRPGRKWLQWFQKRLRRKA